MTRAETWVPVSAPSEPEGGPPAPRMREPLPPGVWNWFSVDPVARAGRLAFDNGRLSHLFVHLLLVVTVLLVGWGTVLAPMLAHFGVLEVRGGALTEAGLRAALVENAVAMIGFPLLWVAAMYKDGWLAWARRLGLRSDGFGVDVALGISAGFAGLFVSFVVLAAAAFLFELPDNEVVMELGRLVDWPLVFFLALASSTSEEVFFRGFLQPRLGIVPTNVLFGLAHLSYGTPLQVVVPMGLGFLFSALVVKRRTILPAILAHFTFNLVMLGLAKLAVDSGAV